MVFGYDERTALNHAAVLSRTLTWLRSCSSLICASTRLLTYGTSDSVVEPLPPGQTRCTPAASGGISDWHLAQRPHGMPGAGPIQLGTESQFQCSVVKFPLRNVLRLNRS